MTKERLEEVLQNIIDWGMEHDDEFMECLVDAMDLSGDEVKELELEEYSEVEDDEEEEELTDEDYEDQFGIEMAIRICRANNIPLSQIEEYGSEAYWINDGINNLQDLYDINENYVIPTGDEDLIRDYREEILEEEE